MKLSEKKKLKVNVNLLASQMIVEYSILIDNIFKTFDSFNIYFEEEHMREVYEGIKGSCIWSAASLFARWHPTIMVGADKRTDHILLGCIADSMAAIFTTALISDNKVDSHQQDTIQ